MRTPPAWFIKKMLDINYKRIMSLGEIVEAEGTELTTEISSVDIKMACVGFARDIFKHSGCYIPDEVFEYSKKLFAWIAQDD